MFYNMSFFKKKINLCYIILLYIEIAELSDSLGKSKNSKANSGILKYILSIIYIRSWKCFDSETMEKTNFSEA